MANTKKLELPADIPAETPVTLTAQQVLELTQSYAIIAKHSSLIASTLSQTVGIDEKLLKSIASGANGLGDESDKKRKRERDPDAPKRPASSFLLFMSDQRPIIKEKHPDMTYSDLMKEIGTLWKALPESRREVYESRYNASKEEFAKLQEEYLAKKGNASPEEGKAASPVVSGTPSKKSKTENLKPTPQASAPSKSEATTATAAPATPAGASKKPKKKKKAAAAPPPPAASESSENDNSSQESSGSAESSEGEVENTKPKKEVPAPVTPTKKAKKQAPKAGGEKKETKEPAKPKEAEKPAAPKPANNAGATTPVKKSKKAKKVVKA